MSRSVATQGDLVVGLDQHLVLVDTPSGPQPTLMPCPFSGPLRRGLSSRVLVENLHVAVAESVAENTVPHLPIGGKFAVSPENVARVVASSGRVVVQGRAIARSGDLARSCADPAPSETSHVVGAHRVLAG